MARRFALSDRRGVAADPAVLRACGQAWARAWGFGVAPTEEALLRSAGGYAGLEAFLQGMGDRLASQALGELRWHELRAAQRFANAALKVARLARSRGCDGREAKALLAQAEIYEARGMGGRAQSCRRRAVPSGAVPEAT